MPNISGADIPRRWGSALVALLLSKQQEERQCLMSISVSPSTPGSFRSSFPSGSERSIRPLGFRSAMLRPAGPTSPGAPESLPCHS